MAPRAGTIAFPSLTTGEEVDAWCEQLVRETGVLLLPAGVYEHAPSAAGGRFRLGYARANVRDCLAALEGWLEARYPRGG